MNPLLRTVARAKMAAALTGLGGTAVTADVPPVTDTTLPLGDTGASAAGAPGKGLPSLLSSQEPAPYAAATSSAGAGGALTAPGGGASGGSAAGGAAMAAPVAKLGAWLRRRR